MTASNVTTKICVQSIIAQMPHALPALSKSHSAQSNKWKRYSKTGREGQPILRRFYADNLPILADVLEDPTGPLKVTFLPMWPWDDEQYNLNEEFDDSHFYNVDAEALQRQHIHAKDFVFSVGEDDDLGTYVTVCPLSYFEREGAQCDWELAHYVGLMNLPFQLEEETESTFSITHNGNSVTPEDAIRLMAAAGFTVNNDYIRMMNQVEAGE